MMLDPGVLIGREPVSRSASTTRRRWLGEREARSAQREGGGRERERDNGGLERAMVMPNRVVLVIELGKTMSHWKLRIAGFSD